MITVYTSITDGKDALIEKQNSKGSKFIAFVDDPYTLKSKVWEKKKSYDRFISPRRNSRAPKILSHQFVDSEYSIWMDGNISLKVPAKKVIDTWLENGKYDIAVCKHNCNNCIYKEALICANAGLDDPYVIQEQMKKYEKEGFGKERGMGECGVIVRKNTSKVEIFNNFWWSEHCRGSVRDQFSFMYAIDKAGIKVNFVEPNIYHNPFFNISIHLTGRVEKK